MTAFDSIVNVEEWISDHYLTTDESKGASFAKRVAERIKEWKADEQASSHDGPWTRFTAHRLQIQHALAALVDAPAEAPTAAALLREALGYGAPVARSIQRGADTITYSAWTGDAGSIQLLEAAPVGTPEDLATAGLLDPVTVNAKEQQLSAAQLTGQLFLSDTPPSLVLLVAGVWVILAERESWPLGRYLAVDLGLVVERNDTKSKGEMQQATVALARENTERSADGTTWWEETIAQSREHAVKVSGELRGAVRESIEIIGNNVLDRHRERGLPVDDIDGADLARQSLRYLYRILFLLFAEASPELEILPTGTPEYDEGYGLSRLRELILDPPVTQHARTGTHLYESLQLLFTLVDKGHNPDDAGAPGYEPEAGESGLPFRNLSADLFLPKATWLIDRVQLSNEALNTVLENLLLSKVQSGRDRGFISYATLGVTELGQVYEGLMSYTGFVAREDLFEVAPEGKADKGSWMLPVSRADDVPADSFIEVEKEVGGGVQKVRRRHPRGSFVFRQSSRDRERSASFYTPQVLTSFTVGQALEELQSSGRISTAHDVLTLSICEPAMGSGAFAVEAVRQLAELYLQLRQEELGRQVPAEDRAREFQKVKAHIALHQVYGVDLNATAVELAEISLWLDTMNAEMDAPWFGLHLRHGNSLIGATRSLYSATQLNKKAWLTATPARRRLDDIAESIDNAEQTPLFNNGIHHFLLPSNGWGATADAKDLKDLVPAEIKVLKAWRSSMRKALTKTQINKLNNLALRVEALWRFALLRIRIAESQISRKTTLWGQEPVDAAQVVSRSQIEEDLFGNLDGAYNRLRLVMDAWCALWFWPLDAVPTEEHPERTALPDLDEWLETLTDILGVDLPVKARNQGQLVLGSGMTWMDLNTAEELDIDFAGSKNIEDVILLHPWLNTVRSVAAQQGFFHWDLDFADIFTRGGFDLQVGNPPWVRPDVDFEELLAESDPWWMVARKPTQAVKRGRLSQFHSSNTSDKHLIRGAGETVATATVLGSTTVFPHLKDQRPDLYRGFMERSWSNASSEGVISLIHPKTHFTEKNAAPLRRAAYLRLRRNWHMTNKLGLFDINRDEKNFDVAIYSSARNEVEFLMCGNAHHPRTIAESLNHDGSGPVPAFKTDDDKWDLRPHKDRIQMVDRHTLEVWKSILEEPDTPVLETRMVYTVNTEAAAVLEKLAAAPRMKELGLQFSSGWNETTDKKKGYFDVKWSHPDSWSDVILQGPHLGVSTPMIKQPNPTMKNNQDWTEIDLEALPEDFIPATSYFPERSDNDDYDTAYGTWESNGQRIPVVSTYRVAWRTMAASTGYRTIYPGIIPAGSFHVDLVMSGANASDPHKTALLGAALSSLVIDFQFRSTGAGHIRGLNINALPLPRKNALTDTAIKAYLRLNCLTSAYAPLWEEITGEPWTVEEPLRTALERRSAQNDIDAIVALSLGITADDLCMIYRTQFPVMRRYDRENHFDANGRIVPKEIMKLQAKLKDGDALSIAQRTWAHPQSERTYVFEYPFAPLDREQELRDAYSSFAESMADSE